MDPQVIEAATRLFAAMGYDATSLEQVADASGRTAEDLRREFGGKQELYLAVMERGFQAEQAAFAACLEQVSCDTQEGCVRGIHHLIDGYLDFAAEHPEVLALWLHRWLSDATDLTELERRYAEPLYSAALGILGPAQERGFICADADLEYTWHTLMWMVHGFGQGGVPREHGNRSGFADPRSAQRFRLHLHRTIHRGLGLPGDYP
ncbi:TetR/AcrR family transcriptional regulator [Nonomuraea sp. NPDC050310]|uniref:TetR/AcrR family transcriptional regulator n=1 Tax=Nonomuraea sp. NPDC050310 TaxID=3154935 RepID=UPI0033CA8C05